MLTVATMLDFVYYRLKYNAVFLTQFFRFYLTTEPESVLKSVFLGGRGLCSNHTLHGVLFEHPSNNNLFNTW